MLRIPNRKAPLTGAFCRLEKILVFFENLSTAVLPSFFMLRTKCF